MLRLQPEKIAAVAQHDYSFEWQLPEQCSTELCSRSRSANDKRACSTHIHDIIVAQLSCEDARAKRPVPANIDTPEENNDRAHQRCSSRALSVARSFRPAARNP